MAVHLSRASPRSQNPGEVLVSSTVREIVTGSRREFAERGERRAQGRTRHLVSLRAVIVRR